MSSAPTSSRGPNKHQQKTEATRRKLMKAARRVFARDGFEAARIESIASEAGYTRGAFYAHFESKENLFFALLEEQSTVNLEKLRAKLARGPSDEQRLAALRAFYSARISDKQTSVLILEFKLYALRHPRLRSRLARAHRAIRAKLKMEALSDILPRQLLRDEAANQAKSAILQGILHGLTLEHAYDPECLSQQHLSAMLGVIFDAVLATSVSP